MPNKRTSSQANNKICVFSCRHLPLLLVTVAAFVVPAFGLLFNFDLLFLFGNL